MITVGTTVKWAPALQNVYKDLADIIGKVVASDGSWLVIEVPVSGPHIPPFVVKRMWEVQAT